MSVGAFRIKNPSRAATQRGELEEVFKDVRHHLRG